MTNNLRTKTNFSKSQLLVFLLVFSLIGYLIFRALAAPNPNLPGDLNNDNTVNITDLSILLSNYGTSNSTADINGDGTVNVLDLSVLLSHYGQSYTGGGTWTFCANEYQQCSFSGTAQVRYGANGSYYTGTFTNGVLCDNSIFGDPAAGVTKHCDYQATGGGGGSGPSCTITITTATNILNTYNAAHAGDTVCLAAGTYDQGQIDFRNAVGTSGGTIAITSADWSNPATIIGRIVTHPPANYITFSHLKFNVSVGTSAASWTIGSDHISLVHDDISNNNTGICINTIDDATYGTAHYTLIDNNRIHNCGEIPSTNQDHGIYDIGYYSTITNNFIYDNVDRGIQLRQDHNAVVEYNVSDNNGEGMIIGDTNIAAVNDEVAYNIFSNSNIRYNIEEFWSPSPPPNPNNLIHDNCVWTTRTGAYTENGGIASSFVGATVTNIKNANPQYVNAGVKDFRLSAGSACTGYGVQPGSSPGV